jgi:uncharacterized protein (TIGR02145 family)
LPSNLRSRSHRLNDGININDKTGFYTINTYQPPKKGGIMNFFNRQGWGRTPLSLVAAAVTVFAGGAVAQNSTDTAYVPFIVNVDATVKAVQGTGSGARTVSMQVNAEEESILRLPLGKYVGVAYAAPGRANAPVITNSRGGKITLNLPAQSYKNAEISVYAVNGKRVLRHKASATGTANDVSKRNLVAGVYLLAVKGSGGDKITSRLTHRGGGMNIAVVFGGAENASTPARLSKKAAEGDWTVTVSAEGYTNASYTFVPAAGANPTYNITLGNGYGGPAYVTAVVDSAESGVWPCSGGEAWELCTENITLNWSAVPGATAYRVYSGASSDGAYTLTGSVTSPTFTHTALMSGTTYYYRISAFGGSGESERSSPVSAKTIVFYAPKSVSARGKTDGSIWVGWDKIAGADGYNVYAGARETGAYSLLETVPSSSEAIYKHEGLELGATYYYRVSAYNGNGEGILSPGVAATIDCKVIRSTFTDTRDNTQYKMITITTAENSQTWMAEDLNYNTASGSWCYGDYEGNCDTYGRLYDWATAMDVEAVFNGMLWGGGDVKHQGVCPAGWHLPSFYEWQALVYYVNERSYNSSAKELKSTSGWVASGTDDFGFSALPGGMRNTDGRFDDTLRRSYWWTASEASDVTFRNSQAMDFHIWENYDVGRRDSDKSNGYSVRCLMD